MTAEQEIDLWVREQIAISGKPTSAADYDELVDQVMAKHTFTRKHLRHMIDTMTEKLTDEARNWTN